MENCQVDVQHDVVPIEVIPKALAQPAKHQCKHAAMALLDALEELCHGNSNHTQLAVRTVRQSVQCHMRKAQYLGIFPLQDELHSACHPEQCQHRVACSTDLLIAHS